MKKLAIALAGAVVFVSWVATATPVFACPHAEEKPAETEAPRTAEKDKAKDKAKPAEKEKAKDTAKDKKGEKNPDTVAKN
jgi:hypothetical protein